MGNGIEIITYGDPLVYLSSIRCLFCPPISQVHSTTIGPFCDSLKEWKKFLKIRASYLMTGQLPQRPLRKFVQSIGHHLTAREYNLILGCVLARQSDGSKVTLTNLDYVDGMLDKTRKTLSMLRFYEFTTFLCYYFLLYM